jgi:hypothetical protein
MLICPRCQRVNPAEAAYCHFDGSELRAADGKRVERGLVRLPHDFVFPSGRRCRSFDELAQGCLAEWDASRDLLRQGVFGQFLAGIGRSDLAQLAVQPNNEADADLALDAFVSRLPGALAQGPKLDLRPRRLNLGTLYVGETRQLRFTVINQGNGLLHGTLSVGEGNAWIAVGDGTTNGQCAIKTRSEQQVLLRIDTRGLTAPQKYSATLTVITNGGVAEVPVRLDTTVQPFSHAPFHGVKSAREMAERMRAHPKSAVPFLESGEVAAWFGSNGWTYPVTGQAAKGVAAVQQFFEVMGLSKPPDVQLVENDLQLFCNPGETVPGQLNLRTDARKWVYANAEADVRWIRITTPAVSGPQQATISFEACARGLRADESHEGHIKVTANAGQELKFGVRLGVLPAEPVSGRGVGRLVAAGAAAGIICRLLLAFPADIFARALAESPESLGRWLQSPQTETRFAIHFVLATFWLGAVVGAVALWRAGRNKLDVVCGFIAGGTAGVGASATLAVLLPALDYLPRLLFQSAAGAIEGNLTAESAWLWIPIWITLAAVSWGIMGGALSGILGSVGQPGRRLVALMTLFVAWLLRLLGLKRAAAFFALE